MNDPMEDLAARGIKWAVGERSTRLPPPPVKIYVAGAHRELDRCEAMINAIRKIDINTEITLDWTGSIRAHGGDQHDNRSIAARAATAWADIDAVLDAHLVWVLLPRAITKGAWTELGAALAFNRSLLLLGQPTVLTSQVKKFIVASWQDDIAARDEDLPLFVAAADRIFDTDAAALAYVRDLVTAVLGG